MWPPHYIEWTGCFNVFHSSDQTIFWWGICTRHTPSAARSAKSASSRKESKGWRTANQNICHWLSISVGVFLESEMCLVPRKALPCSKQEQQWNLHQGKSWGKHATVSIVSMFHRSFGKWLGWSLQPKLLRLIPLSPAGATWITFFTWSWHKFCTLRDCEGWWFLLILEFLFITILGFVFSLKIVSFDASSFWANLSGCSIWEGCPESGLSMESAASRLTQLLNWLPVHSLSSLAWSDRDVMYV